VELRHLETLIAIDEEGTFTAAADMMRTVQSNVSEQIRQLEAELGVTLLARGRSGATPTESGLVVLNHARRIRREVELLREDVAALQGLQVGNASFGIVGTASRWLVPALVADLRRRAPGIELRVNEGASERLLAEVLDQELAQAVVTEPVRDERLAVEHLLDEALVGLAPPGTELPPEPVPFEALAEMRLVLPPANNPLRIEIEHVARARGVTLPVPVEVEGIRLIADLVAAGAGVSVLPETAIPPELTSVVIFSIADLPPRRLALISPKASPLSLADQAVRETVLQLVADARARPPRTARPSD
jgi:LysR family transcriptional regulator, nitrogen assimilation regulatory protein